MKSSKIIALNKWLFTLLLSAAFVTAYGQKPPSEQKGSVRAPSTIKIDGKATEWDNKFQAYSNHTQFYYTISNDDNNLYLTVQADEPPIIRRIINGGITLTINKSGKKKDGEGIHITYPLLSRFTVPLKNPRARFNGPAPVTEGDSLMNVTNTRMNDKSKEIRVIGIKNIDTLISVYNTDGIKAASAFNNKMVYTYEMAISLKTLGLSTKNPARFMYQVMINAMESKGINIVKNESGGIVSVNIVGPNAVMGQEATDFWGEYTLAK
ncbi:MAG: hypothetical protein V4553_01575 [Bacteroidota bacterium]